MTFDERELAMKIRSGDRQGFDAVYQRYADRVMGFALRLTGSRTEAEDLVQDVFLAAYAARSTFKGKSRLLSWLLGIAVRRWRDRCRHRTVEAEALSEGEDTEQSQPGLQAEAALEDQVVRSLTLTKALDTLESPFREALLLVASQGLTYREAAEILGEPVGTVKWRVWEATRRMRQVLRAVEEEFHEMQQKQTDPRANHISCGG